MELRRLGGTNVLVPALGLGTWEIGGRESPDYSHDREAIEIIRYAVEKEMYLIDTAEYYGGGHSEELVGEAIKEFPREKVFVATKVWYTNLRYGEVLKALERSLRRLQVDYVDLYQIHYPNPSIPIKETMKAMEKLVDDGKVRFIGVSNFSVGELKEAMSAMSKYDIVSNQVLYNPVDRQIEEDLLPFCKKNNITIIAYRPLGKGRLLKEPYKSRIEEICRKYRKTPAQVILNWVIRHENVIAIPKTIRRDHLDELLGSVGWRMVREDYEKLPELLSSVRRYPR